MYISPIMKEKSLDLAIETNNLSKYYGNTEVLSNINLKIPKGRLHALIGSNGAGKTTTLKILSGILKPSKGSVRILGFDIEAQPNKVKEQLGYIPETPTLYSSLSVKEFLDFVGAIYSIPKTTLKTQIKKYNDIFELGSLQRKYIGTLSKGEMQRVLISSLMIREPTIFFLDEPFYSLDPKNAVIFRELLKEKTGQGATVLFATHLIYIAEKICDSFTIIEKGKIIAEGNMKIISNKVDSKFSLEEFFIKVSEAAKKR